MIKIHTIFCYACKNLNKLARTKAKLSLPERDGGHNSTKHFRLYLIQMGLGKGKAMLNWTRHTHAHTQDTYNY